MTDWVSLDKWAEENASDPPATEEDLSTTKSTDFSTAFSAGAKGVGSNFMAGGRYLADKSGSQRFSDLFKGLGQAFQDSAEEDKKQLSARARKALEAGITSEDFWNDPLLATSMKAVSTSPTIVATAIPAMLTGGALAATVVASAAGGALSAAQVVDEIYQATDKMPDKELQKESELYRNLRGMMDEPSARTAFNEKIRGYRPLLNFVVGAASGALGPAAMGARALKGGSATVAGGTGRLRGAGVGFAEGAGSEMVQEGVADASTQTALMEGGIQKNFDFRKWIDATLEGGLIGGAMGGPLGGLTAKPRVSKGVEAVDARSPTTEIREAMAPDIEATELTSSDDIAKRAAEIIDQRRQEQMDLFGQQNTRQPEFFDFLDQMQQRPQPEQASPDQMQLDLQAPPQPAPQQPAPTVTQQVSPEAPTPVAQTAPAPVAPEPAMKPARKESTTGFDRLGEGGAAVVDNMYEMLWQKVQAGDIKENGQTSALLQVAKMIRDAGGMQSISDLRAMANDYAKRAGGDKFQEEMRALVQKYSPAPKEPAPAPGRVLADQSTTSLKAEAAWEKENAQAAKRDAELLQEKPDEEVLSIERTGKVGKAKKAKMVADAEGAKRVFDQFPPTEKEIPGAKDTPVRLLKRLVDMLTAAKEADIKISKRNPATMEDHLVFLREAENLAKYIAKQLQNKKPVSQDRILEFMVLERAAREGDFKTLRAKRLQEGDETNRVSQGDVESEQGSLAEKLSTKPLSEEEIDAAREQAEESVAADTGRTEQEVYEQGNERPNVIERKIGEKTKQLIEKTKALKERGATEGERAAAAAAEERVMNSAEERAQNDAWKQFVTVGENKAPKETARKGEELKALKPKVAGVVSLMKKTATPASKPEERRLMPGRKSGLEVDLDDNFTIELDDFDAPRVPLEQQWTTENPEVDTLMSRTARQLYQQFAARDRKPGQTPTFTNTLVAELSKRLMALAGNVRVRIVEDDVFTAVTGLPIERAQGVYSEDLHEIMIPRSFYERAPTAMVRHILLHEVAHAAYARALNDDSQAMAELKLLQRAVVEHFGPDIIAREYGMALDSNGQLQPHEFLSEALSNTRFQEQLLNAPLPPELARSLGVLTYKKTSLWGALLQLMRRALGLDPHMVSVLDATLKITERLGESEELMQAVWGPPGSGTLLPPMMGQTFAGRIDPTTYASKGVEFVKDSTNAAVKRIEEVVRRENASDLSKAAPWLLKLRTLDQIAQAAERYFPVAGTVRVISDLVERGNALRNKLVKAADPLISDLHRAQRKYETTGEWQKFVDTAMDATIYDIHPDKPLTDKANEHLGKDALYGAQGKGQHARLAAQWSALPEDLKDLWGRSSKFFRDRQNQMNEGLVRNILLAAGHDDAALSKRVFDRTWTDADKKLLGDALVEKIEGAGELAKINGFYMPLMRRGNWVVRAVDRKIDVPAGARLIDDNIVEFKDRKEAVTYAGKQRNKTTLKSVWVDAKTGDTHFVDPKTGERVKVLSNDIDGEQRFRATIQNQHVEFFENKQAAELARRKLLDHGLEDATLVERRDLGTGRGVDLMSTQMKALASSLENRKGYRDMSPAQRAELQNALNLAAMQFSAGTRIQSSKLPRRSVNGASKDFVRSTLDYNQSSSAYLARLQFDPELRAAMKSMREQADERKYDTYTTARSQITNEVERRVYDEQTYQTPTKWDELSNRILTASFLDKLMSPAWNILNTTQVATVAVPTIAGRHGIGRTVAAVNKAYGDVAALSVFKQGLKDTAKATKGPDAADSGLNYFDDVRTRVGKLPDGKILQEMLDYLADRGAIDPDAGLEIARLIRSRDGITGKIDTGLTYLEGIARQMPQAIETVNRSVTAIAAFRLEMAKSGDKAKAMRYAQEMVNNTQGLYSNSNAAPIFKKNPLLKLTFQFKKYGQMMYHLLGQQIGKAYRNESPGDRAEAVKTLMFIATTHMLAAGTVGLPTEPIKLLLMGASVVGMPISMDDIEKWEREIAMKMFGNTVGEMVTHGVTRGLPFGTAFDLSSRMGLNSLMTFGEPRGNTEKDAKAYLFDFVAGAPGSLIVEWGKGMSALSEGNVVKAAEQMVPIKVLSDTVKAFRLATEGKKSATGRETMTPYSPQEAVIRALGFTPGREAETGAMRAAVGGAQRKFGEQRRKLVQDWVTATPSSKSSQWSKIQRWNRGQPEDAQISMKDLTAAAKRRKTEETSGAYVNGIRTNKRDAHLAEQTRYYNTGN